MLLMKKGKMKSYMVFLLLSNVLMSTVIDARITRSNTNERFTRAPHKTRRTKSFSVVPVTSSVSASDGTGATDSSSQSKAVSGFASNFNVFKSTTVPVLIPNTTTKPVSVSEVYGKTRKVSVGSTEGASTTPPTIVEFKSSNSISKSLTDKTDYKPSSLESHEISVSAHKSVYAASFTDIKHANGKSTEPSETTTKLSPTITSATTAAYSTNVTPSNKRLITDSTIPVGALRTSTSGMANTQVTSHLSNQNPFSTLFNSAHDVKNTALTPPSIKSVNVSTYYENGKSLGLTTSKDSTSAPETTRNPNIFPTIISQQIISLTISSKEGHSTTSQSQEKPAKEFGSDYQKGISAVEYKTSTGKPILETTTPTPKFEIVEGVHSATKTSQIFDSLNSQAQGTKSETQIKAGADNISTTSDTKTTANERKVSEPSFLNVMMLLGATGNGASPVLPITNNKLVKAYTDTKASNLKYTSAASTAQSENPHQAMLNSEQIVYWQRNFTDVLEKMLSNHKGSNNVIIVPISVFQNNGNVYLHYGKQENQLSIAENTSSKWQTQKLATTAVSYEYSEAHPKYSTTSLTHFSTEVPVEKFSKQSESTVSEAEVKPIIRRKAIETHKEDKLETERKEVFSGPAPVKNDLNSKEPTIKQPLTEIEHVENYKKETLKSVAAIPKTPTGSISMDKSGIWVPSEDRYDAHDSEDSIESPIKTNTVITGNGVSKTLTQRIKAETRESEAHKPFVTDFDYESVQYPEVLSKDIGYPTHALRETGMNFKEYFPSKKYDISNEHDVLKHDIRVMPKTTSKRVDEYYAVPRRGSYRSRFETYPGELRRNPFG